MAVTVWDPDLGATREATQVDIDTLQAKADAYGRLVGEFRSVEEALFRSKFQIEERARTSDQLSGDL